MDYQIIRTICIVLIFSVFSLLLVYLLPKCLIYIIENVTGIIFTLRQPSNIKYIKYVKYVYGSKVKTIETKKIYESKKIAITINDIPRRTNYDNYDDFKRFNKILKLANEHKITLNLFVTGGKDNINGLEKHQMVKASKKHLLGIRGTSSYCQAFYSEPIIYDDLSMCQSLIDSCYDISRVDIPYKFYRPQYNIVTPSLVYIANKLDMSIVCGSVYPYDLYIPFPRWNYWYIKWKIEHNDIVVLHDTPYLCDTLSLLFPYLNDNNYETVTLDKVYEPNTEIPDVLLLSIISKISKIVFVGICEQICKCIMILFDIMYYLVDICLYYVIDYIEVVYELLYELITLIYLVLDSCGLMPDLFELIPDLIDID